MKLKRLIRLHTTLLAVGGELGTEKLAALMCTTNMMSNNKLVALNKKGAMLIDSILLTTNSNRKNTKTETGLKLEGVWDV